MRPILSVPTLVLLLLFCPNVQAGFCWGWSTFDATNPQPWSCGVCDDGVCPGDVAGQSIRHEHRNWHCNHFPVFNEAYGRAFLAFHRQFILDFDNWRLEFTGLGRFETWDANQNSPVPGDDESTSEPFTHCSTGTCTTPPCYCSDDAITPCNNDGDCVGTCEDIRPAGTLCASCQDLPVAFIGDNLDDFASLGEVGYNLELMWHTSYHNGVSPLGCEDVGSTRTTSHDPAFWMAHKKLDEVSRDWQSLQAADTVIVIDRSGSMDDNCSSTTPPQDETPCAINDAREAARMFADAVQDVRMEDGMVADRQHRIGLVTFSSGAAAAVGLTDAEGIITDDDVDNTPFETALTAIGTGGATSIAAGIREAITMLTDVEDPNQHQAILVLTDGKENTPPCLEGDSGGCISGDELTPGEVGEIQIVAVGLGEGAEENNLRDVAERHGGIFVAQPNADDTLSLQKFYVTAFGEIFDEGISLDPFGTIPAGATTSAPFEIEICDDTRLTVVLGREEIGRECDLRIELTTPDGNLVDRSDPGVESGHGRRHDFVRVQLPHGGVSTGTWTGRIVRPPQSQNCSRQRYFYSVLTRGLGRIDPFVKRPDVVPGRNVLATFRMTESYRPDNEWDAVSAQVTLTRPDGPPQTLPLRDDGLGGDAAKGNNVWSVEFPAAAQEAGIYHLRGRFELTEGNCTKVRESEYSIVATPEPDECMSLVCDGVVKVRPGDLLPLGDKWCAWNRCSDRDQYVVSIEDTRSWLKTTDPETGALVDLPPDFLSDSALPFDHECFGASHDGAGVPVFVSVPPDAQPNDVSFVTVVAQSALSQQPAQRCESQLLVLGPPDCNQNGVPDAIDIARGTSSDQDRDGIPDECDEHFHGPELELMADPFVLHWNDLGDALYDVVRGDLRRLRDGDGDFALATLGCLGDDVRGTSLQHGFVPPPGEGLWFLARFVLQAGNGSYDSNGVGQPNGRDDGIASSQASCR